MGQLRKHRQVLFFSAAANRHACLDSPVEITLVFSVWDGLSV